MNNLTIKISNPRLVIIGNGMTTQISLNKEQAIRSVEKSLLSRSIIAEKVW